MRSVLTKYVLLTGSDLGDRELALQAAAEQIEEKIGLILSKSSVVESEPWGFESTTTFLNQALLIETKLMPEQILAEILMIEEKLGRVRSNTQWSSRTIDIDILCSENSVHQSDTLVIPHRFLHERAFALKPLCEIAPNWIHPLLGTTYVELASGLELNNATTFNS